MAYIDSKGYIVERIHGHPEADTRGRVLQHRKLYSDAHGIPPGYIVHHKNGNKQDNRLENLEALPRDVHADHHGVEHLKPYRPVGTAVMVRQNQERGPWNKGTERFVSLTCNACGTLFNRNARDVRKGLKRGRARHYCSPGCSAHAAVKARSAS